MDENELSRKIIGCAISVHRALGPGLLENAYKQCLFFELQDAGFHVSKEKPIPLIFKGISLDCGYRADILVENLVVIEIKSVEELTDIHMAQVITYLKIGHFKLGLLINFNTTLLRNGIRRIIY